MKEPQQILKQYWGYTAFRELQEDIIRSVLEKNDTLALMPTGGGKSICFQVPGLCLEGVTLVITPLVALMKDQVEQLKRRGISALAVHSGMSRREIDIALDNCAYGDVKFLYLSPERLKTELFLERVKKMNVGLLAVDESHCISQWGYEFRPSYLEIAKFREHVPAAPVIAVTATATLPVRKDIIEKLNLENVQVFVKSFARDNLSYSVFQEDNKEAKLLQVLKKVQGTAVVYVRNRRKTKQIAGLLRKNRISALWYHAGLSSEERNRVQDEWLSNKARVVVATNAFGMGIDKPDVRSVVHIEPPDSLEAYYQEAGRAGRDGEKAYAVLIYNEKDVHQLRDRLEESFPDPEFLRKVYKALGNFYKLAVGSAPVSSFDMDLQQFSDNYNLPKLKVYNALKKLEQQGFIQLNEAFYNPSRLWFQMKGEDLYRYQVENEVLDRLVKAILRLYGGEAFAGFVTISESAVARLMRTGEKDVVRQLSLMDKQEVLVYEKKKDMPQLSFTIPRQDPQHLRLDLAFLRNRKKTEKEKLEAVISYVQDDKRCRTQLLLEYFGEVTNATCDICDNCRSRINDEKEYDSEKFRSYVEEKLQQGPLPSDILIKNAAPSKKEFLMQVIRKMVETEKIEYTDSGDLRLKS